MIETTDEEFNKKLKDYIKWLEGREMPYPAFACVAVAGKHFNGDAFLNLRPIDYKNKSFDLPINEETFNNLLAFYKEHQKEPSI